MDTNDYEDDTPPIPPALVAWLDTLFPEVMPSKFIPVEGLWQMIGSRGVVVFLKQKLLEQQDTHVQPATSHSFSSDTPTGPFSSP